MFFEAASFIPGASLSRLPTTFKIQFNGGVAHAFQRSGVWHAALSGHDTPGIHEVLFLQLVWLQPLIAATPFPAPGRYDQRKPRYAIQHREHPQLRLPQPEQFQDQ